MITRRLCGPRSYQGPHPSLTEYENATTGSGRGEVKGAKKREKSFPYGVDIRTTLWDYVLVREATTEGENEMFTGKGDTEMEALYRDRYAKALRDETVEVPDFKDFGMIRVEAEYIVRQENDRFLDDAPGVLNPDNPAIRRISTMGVVRERP